MPKHCFKKAVYLCSIEMKRELHRITKHENVQRVVFIIAQVSSDWGQEQRLQSSESSSNCVEYK